MLPTATPRPVLLREAADLIQSYLRIEQPLSLEELTTDEIKDTLRVQVFRILEGPYANESFLIRNQTVVPMGAAYGGQGLTSLEISDLDGDGEAELLFTYSFGSGLHQSGVSMYAPAYDQYRVFEAEFGYHGDIGLFELGIDEIGIRAVEADPSTLTIRYLDTLGYLGIEEKNGQPKLVVEILSDLPDEVEQNIFSPHSSESREPDGTPLGLVYTTSAGEGLWIIDRDGQHRMLTEHFNARLSPDHQKLLYSFQEDIFIEDLMNGEKRNLTNTHDKIERGYQWWPANPDVIVFNFKAIGEEGPSEGYLGVIDTAGIDYRILDESAPSFSSPALSPDGITIAYNPAGVPTLYHLEVGRETIRVAEYDLDIRIAASPAWSPDGRFLAWKVFGDESDGSSWSAVMVLDVVESQANLLHKYRVLGGTNVMPGLSWSPDRHWLTMLTQGEFPFKTPSLWVLSADGREEHYLGSGISPVWSPDGRWLAYASWPAGGGSYEERSVVILDIESWEPQPAGLPEGAVVVDWVSQVP
jgi:Tol biopolymer transport system component